MASNNSILIKRSAVPGKIPTIDKLDLGELALNTHDGRLFTKRSYVDQLGTPQEAIIEFTNRVPIGNALYVAATGSDTNNGETWEGAFATIERAVGTAASRGGALTLIEVGPGTYTSQGHIDVPDNCMVYCAYGSVIIQPEAGFEQRNVFRVGSGSIVQGFVFSDWSVDEFDNPQEGFAIAFRPSAVINKPPIVVNIATQRVPFWSSISPSLDRDNSNPFVGNGMGCVLADRSVVDSKSTFAKIVVWSTQATAHNGVGLCAMNGATIDGIDVVTTWLHLHHLAINGGNVVLSGAITQYGDFTLTSKGTLQTIRLPIVSRTLITQQPATATQILANKTILVNQLWTSLLSNGLASNSTPDEQQTVRTIANNFVDTMYWSLVGGDNIPVQDMIQTLFDYDGAPLYSDKEEIILFAFPYLRDQINTLSNANTLSQATVTLLTQTIISNFTTPAVINQPSLISTSSHVWSAILGGVVSTRSASTVSASSIEDSIQELDGGTVVASGQDDQGNVLLISSVRIDTETGEITGAPFAQSVNRIATRATIAGSF